jgi:hypothetical protein
MEERLTTPILLTALPDDLCDVDTMICARGHRFESLIVLPAIGDKRHETSDVVRNTNNVGGSDIISSVVARGGPKSSWLARMPPAGTLPPQNIDCSVT